MRKLPARQTLNDVLLRYFLVVFVDVNNRYILCCQGRADKFAAVAFLWFPSPDSVSRGIGSFFLDLAGNYRYNYWQLSQWRKKMQQNYTAVIQQSNGWWIGWVQEIPGVNGQERTRDELLVALEITLRETIAYNREEALRSAENQHEEVIIQI